MLTLNHLNNNIVFCVEEVGMRQLTRVDFAGKSHATCTGNTNTEMAFRKTVKIGS